MLLKFKNVFLIVIVISLITGVIFIPNLIRKKGFAKHYTDTITREALKGRISENPEHWKNLNDTLILNTTFWKEQIKELGGNDAYKILEKQVIKLDDYGQHLTAHQFGDALFEVSGLGGIETCDHRFGQGCFHQFFMGALGEHGESVVPNFSAACAKKNAGGNSVSGCNHGMGHGVMVAFENGGIKEAVGVCEVLEDPRAFYGCIDGIFMEYFTPTHVGRSKEDLPKRTFNPDNPHYPCVELGEKFQPTCYYMQASWWMYLGFEDKIITNLCRSIPGKHTGTCFKSLGHYFTIATDYKKEITLRSCKNITTTKEEEIACRAGAHWAFSRGEEVGEILSEDDKKLCEFSDSSSKNKCLLDSNMITGPIGISVIGNILPQDSQD